MRSRSWAAEPASGVPLPASLYISNPDFAATVSGPSLWDDSGTADSDTAVNGQPGVTLVADPDNNAPSLYSNDGRPQDVTLGLAFSQAAGSDFIFTLTGLDLAAAPVDLGFDTATQSMIVKDDNESASIYGLAIDQLNTNGSTDHFTGEVNDAGGAGIALDLGAGWTGSGAPPAVAIRGNTPSVAATAAPGQDGSVVLQSVNYPARYLAVVEGGARIEAVPVTTVSDPALLLRSGSWPCRCPTLAMMSSILW